MKITVKKNVITYNLTSSLPVSVIRMLFVLSVWALCVYISQGSRFWTFFSGLVFVFVFTSYLLAIFEKSKNEFSSWSELKAWIEEQERKQETENTKGL